MYYNIISEQQAQGESHVRTVKHASLLKSLKEIVILGNYMVITKD